jgi:hypothetical protein
MAHSFKAGDVVILGKHLDNGDGLSEWSPLMDRFVGKVAILSFKRPFYVQDRKPAWYVIRKDDNADNSFYWHTDVMKPGCPCHSKVKNCLTHRRKS